MLTNLDLKIIILGILAVLFLVLSITSLFRYSISGRATKKGIGLAALYSILGFTSITIAIIFYDTNMASFAILTLCLMVLLYGLLFGYHIIMRNVSKKIGADEAIRSFFYYFTKRQ
jgi:steroid 5-alpha reductase family enzyme